MNAYSYPPSPSPTTIVTGHPADTALTGFNPSGVATGLVILTVLGVVALIWANAAGWDVRNVVKSWYHQAREALGIS